MIAKDVEFGVDTARGRIHGVCLQPCRPSNNDRKVFENRGLDVILLRSEKSVYHDVETGLGLDKELHQKVYFISGSTDQYTKHNVDLRVCHHHHS
jgi:hypothetical protein